MNQQRSLCRLISFRWNCWKRKWSPGLLGFLERGERTGWGWGSISTRAQWTGLCVCLAHADTRMIWTLSLHLLHSPQQNMCTGVYKWMRNTQLERYKHLQLWEFSPLVKHWGIAVHQTSILSPCPLQMPSPSPSASLARGWWEFYRIENVISFFWFSAVHFWTPGLHHGDTLLPFWIPRCMHSYFPFSSQPCNTLVLWLLPHPSTP